MHRHACSRSPAKPQGQASGALLPGVAVTLKALKPKDYPEHPRTLGEHLLARRRSLGLYQRDVAQLLGVSPDTVLHWEKSQTSPPDRFWLSIIGFLGYEPWPQPETLGEQMAAFRRRQGWSIRHAAENVGVDETTWADWERGRTVLYREHRTMLAKLLCESPAKIDGVMASRWGAAHVGTRRSR